jgi:hypothetical protein
MRTWWHPAIRYLLLTKAGEKRLQAARKRWSAAQARFETDFGMERAAGLRGLLRAVVASEFAPAAPRASPQAH